MAQGGRMPGQAPGEVSGAGADARSAVDPRAYRSFAEFYPFYLSEHSNRTCRRLHFVGSSLSLVCLLMLVLTGAWAWLLAGLACG